MSNRNSKPLLILGANGMLAKSWQKLLQDSKIPYVAISRNQIDYTDPAHLRRIVNSNYSAVVNCVGFTQVDLAETNPHAAFDINAYFPEQLGVRCRELGLKLVHYSTDYVFDGKSGKPYSENDPIAPSCIYGSSKSLGEQLLLDVGCDVLIVRTSWLFAAHGKNFVSTILQLLAQKTELKVVSDQIGRPTCTETLAASSLQLLQGKRGGIFNIACEGSCSWYELACSVAELADASCRVIPCSTEEFPRPAARPPYSVLDTRKAEQIIGSIPHWRSRLEKVVSQIANQKLAGITGQFHIPKVQTQPKMETLS